MMKVWIWCKYHAGMCILFSKSTKNGCNISFSKNTKNGCSGEIKSHTHGCFVVMGESIGHYIWRLQDNHGETLRTIQCAYDNFCSVFWRWKIIRCSLEVVGIFLKVLFSMGIHAQ